MTILLNKTPELSENYKKLNVYDRVRMNYSSQLIPYINPMGQSFLLK